MTELIKALRWLAKVRICETKIVDCNSCEFHGFCTDPDSDESIADQIIAFKQAADALEAAEKRIAEAVAILQTIEWVGSGAKGRIEDAIGVLLGIQEETE